MSKQKAFWYVWIFFTVFVFIFFYAVGELEQMDFGKSIILTPIPLLAAFPIYLWVKGNDEFE